MANMQYIEALPDAYKKSEDSNNYKLLMLPQLSTAEFRSDIAICTDILDIHTATGETLDYYGDIYGANRGQMNDTQYRTYILNVAMANRSDGTINTLLACLETIFEEKMTVTEGAGKVIINNLTDETIQRSGFTLAQIGALVNSLLVVGVGVEAIETDYGEETFTLGSVNDGANGEYNEQSGLSSLTMHDVGGRFASFYKL